MAGLSDASLVRAFQSYSRAGAAVGIMIGSTVLLGWFFGIELLKTVLPGVVAMKPNAALCLILSGMAIGLLRVEPVSPARLWGAMICASIVLLVSVLTIVEYRFGLSVGIDQLLFTEAAGTVGTSSPGRMALNTAVGLLLLALSLLFLDVETRSGQRPAQYATIAAMTIGVFGVFAYCIDFKALYNIRSFTPMALHTAQTGLMAIVAGGGLGGAMARRLSVAVIIVPFALAWLRMGAERAHYFSTAFGVALLATSNVFIFLSLIWWYALSLNRIDAEGKRGHSD